MTHVESFQCEAQKVLHQDTNPDLKQLQQLLDTGSNLDVELPEIPKLKQVGTAHSWYSYEFTGNSWLTNQSARIDFVIV